MGTEFPSDKIAPMRKISFALGEYYHIYNRGVDKRNIFADFFDINRFFLSMNEFNTPVSIGSIYEHRFDKPDNSVPKPKLIEFTAYCLNPNHFHFIVTPQHDAGIQKFMHKLGLGYTNYFNERHKRSGSLFQGKYKAVHVNSNEYLLHLSAYVNLNDEVHQLGNSVPKLVKSSWEEFLDPATKNPFCRKNIVLDQFATFPAYKKFAFDCLDSIRLRKKMNMQLEKDLFD